MTAGTGDLYRVLGLTQDATTAEIKTAYRRLAKEHHPDQGGDPEAFRRIQRAYDILSDEQHRAEYDQTYIDGAALLGEVRDMLCEYVAFPSESAAVATTLYAAATHAVSRLEFATRLVIKSPERRCGKSRLLDVLAELVNDALMSVNISAAGLVYSLDPVDPPTVILDEADSVFGRAIRADEKTEALRGLINAGFTRGRPYRRYNPALRQVEDIPTFAMAILAGIGDMPDTIEDRAVIIVMRRRAGHEQVSKFRVRRDRPRVRMMGERLAAWVAPQARLIGDAEPDMPPGLNDRAEDAWESLVAVADAAGGDWPKLARAAAIELSADAEEDASENMRLLYDLRDIFGDEERLSSATICERLAGIEEAPWGNLFGKPIDQRTLARLLRPYGVRSTKVRIGEMTRQGYDRAGLWDTWERFAPKGGTGTSGTPEHPRSGDRECSGVPLTSGTPEHGQPADLHCSGVPDVPDTPPESGT